MIRVGYCAIIPQSFVASEENAKHNICVCIHSTYYVF